jgi:lipopolysaccharide/colanic/teichoic acid biosynthesis glycosyltransferase
MEASTVPTREHYRAQTKPLALENGNGSAGGLSEGSTASHELASERARRILNLAAAFVLLVLSTPVMIVIALAIRLTSSGPIFFVQQRVGIDRRNGGRPTGNCRRQTDAGGRPFKIYKFRTMHWNGGNGDRQVWASPEDPRVTRLGRVLRTYRLDELPQLINILRGDMNLVGPRPEQPKIFDDLRSKVTGYERRQAVRPGITGWAQVNQHYDRSVEDVKKKLALDLEYIGKQSVREDLKIMLRTVPVILFKEGAW